jgi:hypothetical protein
VPKNPITLTAGELYILRDPNKATGREAFKLTLTELLSRGALRFQRETKTVLWVIPKQENYLVLVPGARSRAGSKPHIQAALDMIANVPIKGAGAPMELIIKSAHKMFGKDLSKFKTDSIVPTLLREGYLDKQETKALGLFTQTTYEPTAKGKQTIKELDSLMLYAEDLPELASRNPDQAASIIGLLGAGIILMPELRPHYAEIGQSLRSRRERLDDSGDGGGEFEGGEPAGVASGFEDLGAQWDAGFAGIFEAVDGAMDSIDNALDSFDSSFDSADSSDGGGDGGDGGDSDGGAD